MTTLQTIFIMVILLFSQCLYATSIDKYVKVCTDNQANKMGPELCECMGNKGKELSEEEFEFFYAIAAKDQAKVNKGHTTLKPNLKINVMQLTMIGPSKCANELAAQQNSSDTPNNSGGTASTASKSATDAASATVSESADSATQ